MEGMQGFKGKLHRLGGHLLQDPLPYLFCLGEAMSLTPKDPGTRIVRCGATNNHPNTNNQIAMSHQIE